MDEVLAAIPSIGLSARLWPLVETLWQEAAVIDTVVYDNSPAGVLAQECAERGCGYRARPGVTIYGEWAEAMQEAAACGVPYCALLNDDIALAPGTLADMALVLDGHPEFWVVALDHMVGHPQRSDTLEIEEKFASYQYGGIVGSAFMVRVGACPLPDPDYNAWYGDDELWLRVRESGGRLGLLKGAGYTHDTSTTVNALSPWWAEAIAADTERWAAQWGRRKALG